MRGISSQPPFRVAAARRSLAFHLFLLACIGLLTSALSGCASVSAKDPTAELAAAQISIVPSSIDFKTVVVGQKNSQTLKVTNSGKDAINLENLRVSGSGFALHSSNSPILLAPGKHANLTVIFAPSSASAASGSLVISSKHLRSPIHVPLAGSGEKASAELSASPATLSFGSHSVKSSTSQNVTLKNTGNIALSIDSIGVGSPSFSVSGLSKGVSLAPDQTLEFQVWFRPTSSGASSTTIAVSSASLTAPVKLSVSGSATAAPVSTPTATATHSVILEWQPSSSPVSGYHIYRGDSTPNSLSRLTSSLVSSLNFKDASVQAGAHYQYVVTAVSSDGTESPFSNQVSADIPTP